MSGVILTAEHRYRHPREAWHDKPPATWALHAYPIPPWKRAMIGELTRLGETDAKASTFAYVNHGRWLADCPFCRQTQVASKTDQRLFCCAEGCGNAQVGGAFVKVAWPKDADKIEAELLKRATPDHRNWTPGETVRDLRNENAQYGVVA